MAVETRDQRYKRYKKELDHVVKEVLDQDDGSDIEHALKKHGFKCVLDIISATDSEVKALDFKDAAGDVIELKTYDLAKVRIFREFYYSCKQAGRTFNIIGDWECITREEYDKFRATAPNTSPPNASTNTGNHPTGNQLSSSSTLAKEFIRGVKRDMTLFPILKDTAKWDSYQREFLAMAHSQNVHIITDSTFVPSTPEEVALFEEKQAFVYAVFVKTLKLDEGQALVRKYTGNAQKIYSTLIEEMKHSTKAELDADTLLDYVITSRFNDGKWKGTSHAYILHWIEQIRLYHENSAQRFGEDALKKFLQNAFENVPTFNAVRTQEDIQFRSGGKRLTYQQYTTSLLATATRFDKENNITASRPRRTPRNVYEHEIDAYEDIFYDPEPPTYENDPVYDINTTVHEIHKTMTHPSNRLTPTT